MPERGAVFHSAPAAAKLAGAAMRLRLLTAGPALALLCSCIGDRSVDESEAPRTGVQATRQEDGYLFEENARPVLFYRLAPKSLDGRYERSNYIHPLYGLDGEILTEDFPEDHFHHRGVFWTWHQVLVGNVRAGDPWLAQNFSWDVRESAVLADGAGVRVRLHWKSPDFRGGAEAIVEETAAVCVHPAEDALRKVDFEIRLTPLHDDFRLGGSEDDKGYGGFSLRVKMLPDLTFTAANGPVTAGRNAADAGSWMDFSATFGGGGKKSGVAVLVHPSSIGYPQPWILRALPAKSMQNPVWPGRGPAPLAKGQEVVLRYRLILHRGGADAVPLADLWEEYRSADPFPAS